MSFEELKGLEEKYILHTYGRVQVDLVKGQNARAWDEAGKEYIDFTSGIGVNSLGYCDPEWVKAVTAQAGAIQHMSNYYYSPQNIALAKELCEAAQMSGAFFSNSGAEANECAIKIARKYGESRKAYKIITLENSFHGRTLTTLAATGQEGFHKDFLPLTEGFLYAEANNTDSVKALCNKDVCAVMIETVQGEGGVVPLNESFVKDIEKLCREKDMLLIIDEVQTGVGRTGAFYSYQLFNVKPDVVTSAKGLAGGLPIGVCMVSERLKNILGPGQQGSTFGGNPVVCAGAREVVKRVNSPQFLQSVKEKGEYFKKKLEAMSGVEYVRGHGMMLGIKLRGTDAHDVMQSCAEKGLLVLTAKELVRFLPPLTINYNDIDEGLEIFAGVVKE